MTRLMLSTLAVLALSAGAASAQTVAGGATVGTTGVGFEAQLKLGPIFVLRAADAASEPESVFQATTRYIAPLSR